MTFSTNFHDHLLAGGCAPATAHLYSTIVDRLQRHDALDDVGFALFANKRDLAPSTVTLYRAGLRAYRRWQEGDKTVVDREMQRTALSALVEANPLKGHNPLSLWHEQRRNPVARVRLATSFRILGLLAHFPELEPYAYPDATCRLAAGLARCGVATRWLVQATWTDVVRRDGGVRLLRREAPGPVTLHDREVLSHFEAHFAWASPKLGEVPLFPAGQPGEGPVTVQLLNQIIRYCGAEPAALLPLAVRAAPVAMAPTVALPPPPPLADSPAPVGPPRLAQPAPIPRKTPKILLDPDEGSNTP